MHFDATSHIALLFVLIFLGAVAYFGAFKKVGLALDARSKRIADELEEARRLREEAQGLLAEYQAKAKAAEQEAAEIVAKAKDDAERMKVETERQIEDMIVRRTKAAELKIAQAEAKAIADVRGVAADVAVAAAERVLAQKAGSGLGADLVTRSIAEVKSRLN